MGYISFDTPEKYLEWQDMIVQNWERLHRSFQYHSDGGRNPYQTVLYRSTGRTTAALKAAVDFAKQGRLVVFQTSRAYDIPYFMEKYPIVEYRVWLAKRFDKFINQKDKLGNITFARYNKVSSCYGAVVIYDHTVFETNEPPSERGTDEIEFHKWKGRYPDKLWDPDWKAFQEGYKRGINA